MNARRDSDGPEDIDAAFAEIVADLEQDETFARWSSTADAEPETHEAPTEPEPSKTEPGPRDWPTQDEDEEHFVPPEPPPMPIPKPATLLGIGVIVLGVVVLLVPGLAGLATTLQLPLGLVLISAGIGWLLFRLRQTPPDPTDPDDDGAQL